MAKKEVVQEAVSKYSKEQILASNKYYNRHDVINALWTDGSEKSIEEVDDMIEKFMKGMVK
ncbi:hypothetical protein LI208_09770 [Longicatena sp. 210702-DFI.1.36]|uniref:hypothetical protein n=1 Tax=Bacillota TaxID=1239 RepID=UPI001D097DA9|nr:MULTISPECIES: hypothetical protein [Longicatena]MCB6265533.1 hypothetical protein [Longicatena sp. 210702-DFI.1.160]MCB6316314.1 hypothetical protein [Longicatena sp. 210702-DFI.1.100]MCB6430103.1 hypothetical protein [Longicatena sp. 210702-DFI.1.36]MCB6432984.1 hypothetical protein [Longicatena sp. 210702-DFI.1.249]MCB6439725.1 hypothetical protein [Longicatena sp. 210702-DFI.1.255]